MNRRELILSVISLVTVAFNPLEAFGTTKKNKIIRMNRNSSWVAEQDQILELPLNPQHNDIVHIVVPLRALNSPGTIISPNAKIFNKNESFELDRVANFKLKFNALTNSWC
jgi:hypothetical protein